MPGSQAAARRSTLVSVAVNIGLTLAQVAAGIFAGSQALVADAIHSLSDLVSDFVVLYASHHSKKAPSQAYHYGHQRFETAASLILGLLLLVVASACCQTPYSSLNIRIQSSQYEWSGSGSPWCAGNQGIVVSLYALDRRTSPVKHAGCQCLARSVGCSIFAGGGTGDPG